jgi:hypothetical protein
MGRRDPWARADPDLSGDAAGSKCARVLAPDIARYCAGATWGPAFRGSIGMWGAGHRCGAIASCLPPTYGTRHYRARGVNGESVSTPLPLRVRVTYGHGGR